MMGNVLKGYRAIGLKALYGFRTVRYRQSPEAGIALGPILFIIAILAVLAAAIAAGSGSFNGSANSEGNKTKASGLIQIADNLKIGMDRLTMENGIAWNAWTTNAQNTQNTTDLFSPTGGGIAAPSLALAGNPNGDVWYYPQGAIRGTGTYSTNAANTLQLAVLNISAGVCAEINNRANGDPVAPTSADLGNFAVPSSAGNIASTMNGNWPVAPTSTTVVNLYGKQIGCVNNANGGSTGYYFYRVLYAQ
jgi:hypothetical protein